MEMPVVSSVCELDDKETNKLRRSQKLVPGQTHIILEFA
jgi:hypothetical protein